MPKKTTKPKAVKPVTDAEAWAAWSVATYRLFKSLKIPNDMIQPCADSMMNALQMRLLSRQIADFTPLK